MAAAGAASTDRQLVADQLAAAAGENRRPIGEACPILLAAAGGESSDTANIWGDAAEDCSAAGTGGIEGSQSTADFR
jgi:hypothetical protein